MQNDQQNDLVCENTCSSDTFIVNTVCTDDLKLWLQMWINLLTPKNYVVCNGSETQHRQFLDQMVSENRLIKLNEDLYDNCYLCRSDPNDVARTEDRTFICTINKNDAGPTNNWMSPIDGKTTLCSIMKGCMRGRTMYVIPFCMGNPKSPIAQYGIQLTDSLYVAISMRSMARIVDITCMNTNSFIKCVHSVGFPLESDQKDVVWPCNTTKYICHFPESSEILSYGSGYGGNALLGKKCLALRIASYLGKKQGWLAEHMLILKMTKVSENESIYLTAAFPSACGKTNLAMLQSDSPDWKIECIGDDIAWMYPKKTIDGSIKLHAINPENGFFGVLPGTSDTTNPTVMRMIKRNTIFTNVGLTPDLDVWWEGKTSSPPPVGTIRWDGTIYSAGDDPNKKIAHPNSRFTTPCSECDILAKEYDDPEGVPISAIIFGGRRSDTIPLVTEASNWNDGVLFGASLSSETTAAATGKVGVVRNDPFAMLPFCGYNIKDYFNHWIEMGDQITEDKTKIYLVNWFRKGTDGSYLWPGFGKNIHVLRWIFERCTNGESDNTGTTNTLMGTSPVLDQETLHKIFPGDVPSEVDKLFSVDKNEYENERGRIQEYFDRLPGLLLKYK